MKSNKIILTFATITLLTLIITPVFANGGYHDYKSDLYAGRKHEDVGLVTVDRFDDKLIIVYETEGPWFILETHLEVADSLEAIPQTKKGNPKVGHFTYANEHDMVKSFIYEVDVEGDNFFIVAHAVVYNEDTGKCETAWGQGANSFEFPGNSWALGFTFPNPPPT